MIPVLLWTQKSNKLLAAKKENLINNGIKH